MRGTPNRYRIVFATPGIIPAYAGNTRGLRMMLSRVRDHPRVCGEHSVVPLALESSAGSSPRMRGTPYAPSYMYFAMGIIPAYAGNTSLPPVSRDCRRDHPRVCGEHHSPGQHAGGAEGSSPRMRGTHQPQHDITAHMGIIPAYAGNTKGVQSWQQKPRDHPRVCGEHNATIPKTRPTRGSSPRMRGTLRRRPFCV